MDWMASILVAAAVVASVDIIAASMVQDPNTRSRIHTVTFTVIPLVGLLWEQNVYVTLLTMGRHVVINYVLELAFLLMKPPAAV